MLRAVAARSRVQRALFPSLVDGTSVLSSCSADAIVAPTSVAPAASARGFAAEAGSAPPKPAAKSGGGGKAGGGKKKDVVKVTVKQPDAGRKYGHGAKHRPDAAERRAAEVQARMKAQAAAAKAKPDSGLQTDDEELQAIYSLFEQGKIDTGGRDLSNAAAAEEASGYSRAKQMPLAFRETIEGRRRFMDSQQYERLIERRLPAELKGQVAVVSDDFDAPAQTDLDLSDAEDNLLVAMADDEQLALSNKRGYAASSPIVMSARHRLSGLSKAEVAAAEAAAVSQRLAARASVSAADRLLANASGVDEELARLQARKKAAALFASSSSSSSSSSGSDSDSVPAFADAATTSKRAAAVAAGAAKELQQHLDSLASASSSSPSASSSTPAPEASAAATEAAAASEAAAATEAAAAQAKAKKLSDDLAKLLEDGPSSSSSVAASGAAGDAGEGSGDEAGSVLSSSDYEDLYAPPSRDPLGRLVNNKATSYNLLEDREGARATGAGNVFPSKEFVTTRLGAEMPDPDDTDDGQRGQSDEEDEDEDGSEGSSDFEFIDPLNSGLRERQPLPKPRPSILRAPISRALEEADLLPWKQLRGCVDLNDENDALLTEQAKQLLKAQVASKLETAALRGDSDAEAAIEKDWRANRGEYLKTAKDKLRQQYLAEEKRRQEQAEQGLISLSGDDSSDYGGDPLDMRYIVDRGQQYRDWRARRGLQFEDSSDAEAKALVSIGVDEEDGTRIAPAFGDDLHKVPRSIIEELATPYEFNTFTEGQLYPDALTVREASMTPDERMLDEQRKKLRDLIERPLPIVNRPIWPFFAMVAAVDQVQQVVSGGMIASTRCCIIVGNGQGGCGFGIGKDKEPFNATKQALANAQRDMIHLSLHKGQLYHDLIGKRNSLYVILRTMPSSSNFNNCPPFLQDVFEMIGLEHVSAKVIGSRRRNPYNVVQALFDAFNHHYSPEHEAAKRGLRMQWQSADRFSPRSIYPFSPTGPRYPGANQRLSGMGKQRV